MAPRGLSMPSRIILFVQVVAHAATLMFSLMVMVPMSVHQEHFRGKCILFSTGTWQEMDGQFKVDWASQAYCNFAIFVSVIAFVASLASLLRTISYLRKNTDASFFAAFCQVLADAVMAVFTLIAALFITLGFKTWCGEMTRRFEKCQDAAGNDIDKADDIDSDQFYFHLALCQAGMWVSFVMFFMALAASLVRLRRLVDRENLRVSMAKERKKLLNEDLVTDVPATAGGGAGVGGRSNDEDECEEDPDIDDLVEEDLRPKKRRKLPGKGRKKKQQERKDQEEEKVVVVEKGADEVTEEEEEERGGRDATRGGAVGVGGGEAGERRERPPSASSGNEIYVCSDQQDLFASRKK